MPRQEASAVSDRRILLFVILVLCAAPSGAASFRVLGTNYFAGARDVSADGSAVVWTSLDLYQFGARYRDVGGANTLIATGQWLHGGAVSADGSVVVGGRAANAFPVTGLGQLGGLPSAAYAVSA